MKQTKIIAGLLLAAALLFSTSCGAANETIRRTEQAAVDSVTGGNNMNLHTTAAVDSAISLTWDAVPGADGYNLYNGSNKIGHFQGRSGIIAPISGE